MDQKNKKRRLFLRRLIVCTVSVCLCALFAFGAVKGAAALIRITKADAAQTGMSPVSGSVSESSAGAAVSEAPGPASAPGVLSSRPVQPVKPPPAGTPAPAGWFRDAVFVGDSRTEGLENLDGLDGATYYAVKGLMVDTIYTKQAIREGGSKVTVMQALRSRKFKKVYIMLGINELGWSSFATFISDYGKAIDDIKCCQPGTRVYLQAILPVTAEKSQTDSVYNNSRIASSNDAIRKLAKTKKVDYLAADEAVKDASGALPAEATVDGVHLNAVYCKKWCEYLMQHIE